MDSLPGPLTNQLSLDDPAASASWDAFVEKHPEGTPFHLTDWLRTLQETYGYLPFLPMVRDGDGKISGVFPAFLLRNRLWGTRLVSVPFSDYGGPLFIDPEAGRHFCHDLLDGRGRLYRSLEVRGSLCGGRESEIVHTNYYKRHILHLSSDPEEVLKRVDKRTMQYSIRKARKSGVTIREDNTGEGMEAFYRLNLLTRKKHGVPSQPKQLFSNLFRHMVASGRAFILLAEYRSKAIAGGIFFRLGDTVYYKYNASDPAYLTAVTPNHLLSWHAIEHGCLQGYHRFDLGRTSPDNEGLMRYKAMWGGEPINLQYYFHPVVQGASSTEEKSILYLFMTRIWRALPDGIAEALSPRIYRYFG